MSNSKLNDFTGVGLSYPIKLNDNGSAVIEGGFALIKSSLNILFRFERGFRYFLYDFGMEFKALLEEPNDDVLLSILDYRIEDQLTQWEKRVKILSMVIERPSDSQVRLRLEVGLNGTDIKDILVFPFNNEQ